MAQPRPGPAAATNTPCILTQLPVTPPFAPSPRQARSAPGDAHRVGLEHLRQRGHPPPPAPADPLTARLDRLSPARRRSQHKSSDATHGDIGRAQLIDICISLFIAAPLFTPWRCASRSMPARPRRRARHHRLVRSLRQRSGWNRPRRNRPTDDPAQHVAAKHAAIDRLVPRQLRLLFAASDNAC